MVVDGGYGCGYFCLFTIKQLQPRCKSCQLQRLVPLPSLLHENMHRDILPNHWLMKTFLALHDAQLFNHTTKRVQMITTMVEINHIFLYRTMFLLLGIVILGALYLVAYNFRPTTSNNCSRQQVNLHQPSLATVKYD